MVTAKPLAARVTEARSRARQTHARVYVIESGRCYEAVSQSGHGAYLLQRTAAGWSCGCAGWHYTGMCYHLGQLARRAERERWPLGRIAPRPTA